MLLQHAHRRVISTHAYVAILCMPVLSLTPRNIGGSVGLTRKKERETRTAHGLSGVRGKNGLRPPPTPDIIVLPKSVPHCVKSPHNVDSCSMLTKHPTPSLLLSFCGHSLAHSLQTKQTGCHKAPPVSYLNTDQQHLGQARS